MKKLFLYILLISVFAGCVEEVTPPEEILDPVRTEPLIHAGTVTQKKLDHPSQINIGIDFHGRYIFGGSGLVETDQNLNNLSTFSQRMWVNRMINYNDEFVCLCTDEGIFILDRNFSLSQVLDLHCSDMEINRDGQILFVSGIGQLSPERQLPANILTLDMENRKFDFYSDPRDSIDTFLQQIEILSNGKIFAFGSNGTIYEYEGKNLKAEHTMENVDLFPVRTTGSINGNKLLGIGNDLYYYSSQIHQKLLKYSSGWEAVFDLGYEAILSTSNKDSEIVKGYFNSMDLVGDQIIISAQRGAIKVDVTTHKYDFYRDPNFPIQFVSSVHSTATGDVIIVLGGNDIVKYSK